MPPETHVNTSGGVKWVVSHDDTPFYELTKVRDGQHCHTKSGRTQDVYDTIDEALAMIPEPRKSELRVRHEEEAP